MIYVITGHLGSGKTLLAVQLAVDEYLRMGKRVASNMTLNLDKAMGSQSKVTALKLPYIPRELDLRALGEGYDVSAGYDESKFGLVLLDEAGTWLNSRDWNDKDRRGLFQWVTHARKFGWDVALIVQDFEALDTQIRRAVTEIYVRCSRLDRVKVPFLPLRMPRVHVATGLYGGPMGSRFKRWYSQGTTTFGFYNTTEAVRQEYIVTESGLVDGRAVSSMLSAWHLRGRYLPARLTSFDRLSILMGMVVLVLVGGVFSACLGRSPWQAAVGAWRRFQASREPVAYSPFGPASRVA